MATTDIAKWQDNLPAEVQGELEKARQEQIQKHGMPTLSVGIVHGSELFTMPDGSNQESFKAVVLAEQRFNIKWIEDQELPECSAPDAKTGSKYGKCSECEFNQWGSDGKGKACKNQSILLIWPWRYDTHNPYRIVAPPTSMSGERSLAGEEARKAGSVYNVPSEGVVVEFYLEHKEEKGRQWSRLHCKDGGSSIANGDISPDQFLQFRKIAKLCSGIVEEELDTTTTDPKSFDQEKAEQGVPDDDIPI